MCSSKTQKCTTHGGRSTGPKTAEGKQRIATARTKHGAYAKDNRLSQHAAQIRLRQLEDMAHVIGLIKGPRTRGRKPDGYMAITSIQQIKALIALESKLKRSVNGKFEP